MNIGVILVIVLIIILLGGFAPHFYSAAPWRPGYGFGNGGISVLGAILLIVIILALAGYL